MERKNRANQVLAGALLLFVLASVLKYFYRELLAVQLLHFVAEAAIVGGVADWFAVTALFRKPLGFSWHTALITRNRERVISAITDMINDELLSVQSIKQQADKVCFVSLFINWVEHKEGKTFLKVMFSKYIRSVLDGIDLETVAAFLHKMLEPTIRQFKLTPQIKTAVAWAVEHHNYEQAVSCIVDECIIIVQNSDTKQLIYRQLLRISEQQTTSIFEKVVFWLGEQTDSINISQAADAAYEELLMMLAQVKHPDHVLYQWIHDKLLDIIVQLENEASWQEAIEEWKQVVINRVDITRIIEECSQVAIDIVRDSSNSPIMQWLHQQAGNYWTSFTQNKQAQRWLETGIKQAVYKLIESEHQLIGVMVGNALNQFSDEDLNQFIEDKAGDDLQWIRINGCIVGAVIGMILFAFLHLIYDPFVVPVVQGIVR